MVSQPLLLSVWVKANIPASELITNREIVSARIRDDLLNRAKEFNIMLEDVSIVSSLVTFPQGLKLTFRPT
jgi:hypothetical protein